MHIRNKYLILLFIGYFPVWAMAAVNQDSIPPIFTTLPQDISIDCQSDIEAAFIQWYSDQAGAVADNGEATIFPTLSQAAAIDSLVNQVDSICSNNNVVTLGFFATDSCGNRSDSTYTADFIVNDILAPSIISPALDVEYTCHTGIRDSLQLWLDVRGYAAATDACSDSIIWTNYSWNDSQGQSGFSLFDIPTDIIIDRTTCLWSVEVSFFLEDGCGNANVTRANFSITADEEAPQFSLVPNDTLISCEAPLISTTPLATDGCDQNILVAIEENSTQATDTLSCAHYNYELTRRFSASDICGNITDTFQVISVRDTIKPTIIAEQSKAVDCNADLTIISDFAIVDDNCASVTLSYTDSLTFSSACQNQVMRKWTATDICGNLDSLDQLIQVQDFSGPEFASRPRDTIVLCNNNNIEATFENWLNSNAHAVVIDNCNNFTLKGLAAKVYSDTSEISMATRPSLIIADCTNNIGAISSQQLSFVAFDICGNITQQEALFSIIDPEAPVITSCPRDFEVQLSNQDCETTQLLTVPSYTDNCLLQNDAIWVIKLNGSEITRTNTGGDIIILDAGIHTIEYELTDCGGNAVQCSQEITVSDSTPPILTCPADATIYLEEDACNIDYDIPSLINYSDNCSGMTIFSESIPSTDAFLEFNYNAFFEAYLLSDFFIEFGDLTLPEVITDIRLTVDYRLRLNGNSTISIKDENDRTIATLRNGDCTERQTTISINPSTFLSWNQDNKIFFSINNNGNGEAGTEPCESSQIDGLQGTDNVSYLRVKLEYATANITTELRTESSSDTITNSTFLTLGTYDLVYSASDLSSNTNSCTSILTVLDTISPSLSCVDLDYTLDPLLQDFYPILFSDLEFEVSDNCGVDSSYFFPRQVFCSDLNTALSYTLFFKDASDNLSSCTADINMSTEELKPEFLSGLCFNDTLKLISNLPDNLGYNIRWSGPNGFNSNQLNPVITNITSNSSGNYILTATSPTGCAFTGEIEVDVNEIDSPEIFASSNSLCNGETVLLNTNSFTEIVEYFWYEGISPNGTLIGQTDGPSFSITPLTGNHFYYVEIKGNGCNSNPSNTLELSVTPPPVANIPDPFISVCVGDDLALMTDVFGPNFSYEWTGPNNYNSKGQFPEVINNIQQENQGTYTLVIKQGVCISDTATAQVVIFNNPETPVIQGESIFCEGQSAVLSVPNIPNGTRFTWFNNGNFFQSVNSNTLLIPAISNQQSGNWTVIAEQGICQSDTSAIFQINVESTLNIGATNNGPHCEGDSVILTSSFIPDATYLWEDPNGVNYAGRIVSAPAIAGLYTVTITTLSNCIATTTTSLEVGDRPMITALSNTSLSCMAEGSPVTLVPSIFPPGNYLYNWSGPNNYRSNLVQPTISNFSEEDNGSYTLEVINGNCESLPVSTEINITTIPPAPVINANTDPCEDDGVTITIDNPTSGNQTAWIWNTPFGQFETAIPELVIPRFAQANNGLYSVVQEKNGCRSETSDAILIEIQTEPATPIISGGATYCEGESITLTADPSDADTYTWLTPSGTVTTTTNILIINSADLSNNGSYSVFFIEGNCESENSAPVQVQVESIPPSVSFELTTLEVCELDLSSTEICIEPNNFPYDNLSLIDNSSGLTIAESNSDCFLLDFLTSSNIGSYNFTVVANNGNCRSIPEGSISITTNASLESGASIDNDINLICDQFFSSLTATNVQDEAILTWTTENPNIDITNANTSTATFSNLSEGKNTIFLQSSSITNCGNTFLDTAQIIVVTAPEATDDSYDLELEETIFVDPLSNDNYDYEVIIELTDTPSVGSLSLDNMMVEYSAPSGFVGQTSASYRICYIDCPDLCSEAEINFNIGENTSCFVGNVITPNGDGYNDRLQIPCLDSGNFPQNSLVIFNQWGDELFTAAPYNNNWTAQHNGKTLPAGTYFYILDLGDGSKPTQGYITLEL